MKEYTVIYEQYFIVEAESADDAVDFVWGNIDKATLTSDEKPHYRSSAHFICFDDEGKEYNRDDL